MHERQGGLHVRVGQVRVELPQLMRGEHSLVDERATRQRREVDVDFVLGALAQHEGQSLEVHALGGGLTTGHEELTEPRHDTARGRAEGCRIGRDEAPAQHAQAFLAGDGLDARHRSGLGIIVAR